LPADLKNTRLKAGRAKKELDSLRANVAAYMEPAPYRFATERDGNDQSARIFIEREPDPEWGLDVGALAIQARSALDLLVKQLVIDSGNDFTRGNKFPIFLDHDEYQGKGNAKSFRERMLGGVAKRHRRIIDEYQPYQAGKLAHRDPLAILSSIANQDKHEDVHVVLGVIASSEFRLTQPDGSVIDVVFDKTDHSPYRRIEDGMELLGLVNAPESEAAGQGVDLDITGLEPELVFEGDTLVSLDDVERAVLRVAEIIERFDRRLSS
jgi:hypothetical protein